MFYTNPMSIEDIPKKIKGFMDEQEHLVIVLIIVLVAFASFGMGRLSKIESMKEPLRIEGAGAIVVEAVGGGVLSAEIADNTDPNTQETTGALVGSKNGSKYHYPWCSGAKRIKPENIVNFASSAEAQKAGYTPAKNCKGLK